MKWFRHMTRAFRDESLLELRDEFGLAGYGAYWIILELIGEKLGEKPEDKEDPSLRLSDKNWRNFVNFSPKKFQKFLTFLQKLELFLVEIDGAFITIKCPNLLKYRDEWARKKNKKIVKNSGVTPESLRSKETETETETDTDTESSIYTRYKSCNDISSEPPAPSPVTKEDHVLEIPLKNGKMYAVKADDIDRWKQSYPALDVDLELLRIRDWNHANPGKRKTSRGISRHINSWLSRCEKSPVSHTGTRAHRNASACFDFMTEEER